LTPGKGVKHTMRPMSVTIREWKGAWWIFINHHGTRKAKRIGTGAVGKKAARQAAQQIQARLALVDCNV
jgi:hypothetical protein